MRTFTRCTATLIALALAAPAWADGPPRPGVLGVGPEQFGRVFQRARRSIVRVRTASTSARFDIGTFIGAQGEFLFGARQPPPAIVWVTTADGAHQDAHVLAHSPSTGLAVARVRGAWAEPFDAAHRPELALDQWVVSVRLDAQGAPEPFAGVVSATARPFARERGLDQVDVATPAEPGSPILTTDGRLVAVAIDRGARRTRAILLASLLPFLRQDVLGQ